MKYYNLNFQSWKISMGIFCILTEMFWSLYIIYLYFLHLPNHINININIVDGHAYFYFLFF